MSKELKNRAWKALFFFSASPFLDGGAFPFKNHLRCQGREPPMAVYSFDSWAPYQVSATSPPKSPIKGTAEFKAFSRSCVTQVTPTTKSRHDKH